MSSFLGWVKCFGGVSVGVFVVVGLVMNLDIFDIVELVLRFGKRVNFFLFGLFYLSF